MLVEQLEALRIKHRGALEESELRLTCPQCHKRNLGFRLGDTAPLLLAHCLSPKCSNWDGPDILRRFGLPLRLSEDQAQSVRIYFGSPRRESIAERAASDRLDAVYSSWLGLCSLSEAHRSHLIDDRGFRPAFIREASYGSWEPPVSLSLADTSGIPGLDSDGKPLLNSPEYKGIIVPVRSVGGKIEALKLRLNSPPPGGKKMRTFGSADCKGAYVVHVPVAVSPSKKVVVVEGELKADYCWQSTHKATIGLPGVNGGLDSLRQRLLSLEASEVCLALDQDEPGQDATETLIRELHEAYSLSVMMWDGTRAKGLDDALLAGVETKEITALEWIEQREAKSEMSQPPKAASLPPGGESKLQVKTYSGIQVLRGNFPAPPELVKTLLPTGLSLLAGKSKIGKSYLLLDLCLSVATGSPLLDLDCEEGKVVYLALEDTPRSLQQRMQTLHSVKSFDPDKLDANLVLVPSSSRVPRMPQGFDWLKKETEDAKLVVIDTFERFRPSDLDGSRHSYSGDYALLEELKTWSEERELAVLFSHHVRKNTKDADDAFDTILGSSGIPGASDTLIVLHRTRGMQKGRLIAAGREIQHVEYAVRFDDGIWSVDQAGEAEEKKRLPPAAALVELLKGGVRMLSTDIQTLADQGKIHGHSFAVLQKAKAEAGVELESQGKQRLWHIPNMEQPRCDGVETT